MSKRTHTEVQPGKPRKTDAEVMAESVLAIYLLSEALEVNLDDAAAIYLRVMSALNNAMAARAQAN